MSQITLVRHGQANTNARDERSYDRLSDLGHQQAAWLGAYFKSSSECFSRVYSGTLQRHVETAASMGLGQDALRDARLNELEYFTLAHLLQQQYDIAIPQDRAGFVTHLPTLFTYWRDGRIADAPETFDNFQTRVTDAISDIAAGDGPALVVTSGGLIGMVMRVTMGLDIPAMAHVCLAIQNTSLHRWTPLPTGLGLTQFNATPHLDTIARRHAQTHL